MQFKIGAFKKLTGLSEGTLRYYEKIGLISPARDDANDYRCYDEYDFLKLVQIKQFNGFEIPLTELLENERIDAPEAMHGLLESQKTIIENRIKELYDRLARIQLHQTFFEKIRNGDDSVERLNNRGIYRLFVTDPKVASHPETPAITARWLSKMPYTHATIRIAREELLREKEGPYKAQLGIGMLERYFNEMGERFTPPMEYTPPHCCVQGMACVGDLGAITRKEIAPFFDYLDRNAMIPIGDLFGWIVHAGKEKTGNRYCLSLRIAVG